jgi:hypothetical protein
MDSRDHFPEDRAKAIGSFPRFGEETNLKKIARNRLKAIVEFTRLYGDPK